MYSENVTLNAFDSVGTDYSFGSEIMVVSDPLPFLNVNFMGNIYEYRIKGVINSQPFYQNNFNWSLRMNNGFKIMESLMVQLNMRYHSPEIEAQEREAANFSADLSVKKDFMGKKLSLTLQVRDLLKTRRHESTTTGVGFYSYNYHAMDAPVIMLNLRFNFNNYKREEDQHNNDQQDFENGNEDS